MLTNEHVRRIAFADHSYVDISLEAIVAGCSRKISRQT